MHNCRCPPRTIHCGIIGLCPGALHLQPLRFQLLLLPLLELKLCFHLRLQPQLMLSLLLQLWLLLLRRLLGKLLVLLLVLLLLLLPLPLQLRRLLQ